MTRIMTDLLEIDGSMGEGGGQVLRTSLSLSIITGKPVSLNNIRANRDKPGLRPQHLMAVRSAARISNGIVRGDRVGSTAISFQPGPAVPGNYLFDIGTAGATSLVMQTLLLPLALADGASTVRIHGGTHVPWSPCFHYLDRSWRPLLNRIGIAFNLKLEMAGFYPGGGGQIAAQIAGSSRIQGLQLRRRGRLLRIQGISAVADLPVGIAERQRKQALERLNQLPGLPEVEIEITSLPTRSKGTLLLLEAEFEQGLGCFFALGARGKRAERVADEAVDALVEFLATDATVDHWSADQLLLPLALADAGSTFVTSHVSEHLLTNAEVIRQFLPVDIAIRGVSGEPARVDIEPGS
jgi:RNA 3'-terminal phosphate cyclase (ATP)